MILFQIILSCFCFFQLTIEAESVENGMKITILYDNYAYSAGMKTDWGFSCLIEGAEKKILFDTGTQSDILFHNIQKLKTNIKDVDLVVISHNHGDHTGGLSRFLQENHDVSIYLPDSTPDTIVHELETTKAKVLRKKEPFKICNHVYLTGEMGDRVKEQSLVVDTDKGVVVITGCAHPGIVSIVERAKKIIDKEIHLVFGGFHLMQHSEEQVRQIISRFKELGVKNVGATHCTGDKAIEQFKREYGDHYVQMGVGRILTF